VVEPEVAPGAPADPVGRSALNKASWRLLPLIGLGYGIAYMDRANISFAALQMNKDLGFSATVYGLGGGLFFLSYALLEVPSNLMLVRFGARRWIARIMLTWGLIAAGMMFVRTPMQFYIMRFLLGATEAGFFPGVVFYLMNWFPASERGRAISRFYIALPLSSVVMGILAGALLGLRGYFGLAGWQWLFLVEGLPAVLLSVAILFTLPNGPADANWLTEEERKWIVGALVADRASVGESGDPGVVLTLVDPRVWLLGIANICTLGSAYSFVLSAPTILIGATHLSATKTGFLIAAVALFGAVGMALAGWYSDLRRERHLHTVVFLAILAAAFFAMSVSTSPWAVVAAYAIAAISGFALQTVFWLIPSDVLHGKSAAVGVAFIGSIGMVGAFFGPYAWGVARDRTGNYHAGLMALAAAYLVAAIMVLLVRKMARSDCAEAAVVEAV
jgi:ACS family tartrate transporter-like MFS transporter